MRKKIIDTALGDDNYFYDGAPLTNAQRNQLKNLFLNRMNILNEMFNYTDNEVKRLEELNTSLKESTQQMYRDFNNLYQGRLKTQGMEVYNNQTWFESRMSFNFYGNNSY